MNESFKEKDEKYREWTTRETREKKVAMAVMVPLIVSHDGAVYKDTVRRWKNFASDIRVYWVRMAQSVLRYNLVVVGKFFDKGGLCSEAWRRENSKATADEPESPPERIQTTQERMARLDLERIPENAVCVRVPSPGTPPTHGVRLTSAERGNPILRSEWTNQPTYFFYAMTEIKHKM